MWMHVAPVYNRPPTETRSSIMDISPQIDPTSTFSILENLSLAIDETKLINSINISRKMIRDLQAGNPSSERLIFLKREVSNLEKRLAKIRAKAGKTRTITKLTNIK